jgi:hypothetical protein
MDSKAAAFVDEFTNCSAAQALASGKLADTGYGPTAALGVL